eukprot:scaffold322335_cov21-Tisochrysis_lutea.AAC.1
MVLLAAAMAMVTWAGVGLHAYACDTHPRHATRCAYLVFRRRTICSHLSHSKERIGVVTQLCVHLFLPAVFSIILAWEGSVDAATIQQAMSK